MLTSGKKKPLQTLLGFFSIALSVLGLSNSSAAFAQANTTTPTTIVISDTPKVTNAKRLGINLGTQDYWDSGMMMRNLAFNNPGFEAESWQTILHCKTVTATSCTDDDVYTYWPANFLAGATASFIVGRAAGTTATVTSSTAPNPGLIATTIQMSGLSVAPSAGDYVVVRKEVPGNAGAGWWTMGTATYSTETKDLSPNTPGKQALRVDASGSGQQATLANFDDGTGTKSFLQLNGSYTISFRAKSTGGNNILNFNLKRLIANSPSEDFIDQNVTLTNQWQDYSFTYKLSEPNPKSGTIALSLTLSGGSLLIDDAAFTEDAAPNNPTVFRNSVVAALQALHPGTLRHMDGGLNWGSSIDNQLATDFARERAGYSNLDTLQPSIAIGLPDFLVLCKTVGADPWYTMPTGMTTQEMSNLMDYLGGSTSTVYGAKRAALGQTAPWTTVFGQIHLEFGNEVWNPANPGANITDPAAYGKRAAVIFAAAKASPSYSAKSFDLVLDGFQPYWTQVVLQNSSNYDTVGEATYNYGVLADTSSKENIYGPMLAEPEWRNSTSNGWTALQAQVTATAGPTPANLAVYETNMGTISGTATQAQVNTVVPSLGAGLAVAANMLIAQRDLGVTVQNMFALEGYSAPFQSSATTSPATSSPIWGAVVDMGGPTNLKRPMFLSEELANSAILPTMLTSSQSGSNPTWNQAPNANEPFNAPGTHYIQNMVYTDGTTLNVVLFNLSRTSALPVNFAGVNAPIGTATVSTLTAATIDATNEVQQNVAITSASQSLAGGATLTLPPFSMTVISVPAPIVPIQVFGVTTSCANVSISPGGSTSCSSTVAGQGKYNRSVVWSAAYGNVSSSGVYTAPATLPATGKDVVTATSAGDSTKIGTFTILVAPNAITAVTASCPANSVNQGATIRCTAKVAGTGSFSNAFTWSSPTGTVAADGTLTAPATGTSITITATSVQDPTKSASVNLQMTPVLVMSPVTTTSTGTSVTVNFTTNMVAAGGVSYGTTPVLTAISPYVNYIGTAHSITLTGLQPSTKYYMSVFSYVGNQSQSQNITATTTNGAPGVSGISVNCTAASLLLGGSTGCVATVQGSGNYSSAVTWSASSGSISSTGVLLAPLSLLATSITVTATSVQDPTKSGSSTLSLSSADTVTAITVSCQDSSIPTTTKTTCSPTVTTTGNASKAVTWTTSAGTVSQTGLVTAPVSGSSLTVTATSVANPAKSASAVITLTPLPTITSLSVACQATSIAQGGSTTCVPTVSGTGSYTSAVNWSTSAGTITPTGTITAPSTGTSVTVTATSTQDPTKSASVNLQLTSVLTMGPITTSVTGTSVTLTFTTSIVAASGISYGTTPAFTAITPYVNYQGTAHTITMPGLQPSTKYYLSVFSYVGGQSTNVAMTVTTAADASSVTGVNINCSPATLAPGTSEVCVSSVSGTGSYSSAVTWSSTSGSITQNGLVTAPATGTSLIVKATSVQDPTKSATATIAISQPAAISSLKVFCPVSTLPVLKSVACTATAAGTGIPTSAVTWSASAGAEINSNGVLTSPATGAGNWIVLTATSTQDPTKSGSTRVRIVENLEIVSPTFSATPTTIVLSWNLTDFAYSSVAYNSGPATPSNATTKSTTAATHASFTLTGLTPGTTYYATIISTNKWGTVSQTVTVTTLPK